MSTRGLTVVGTLWLGALACNRSSPSVPPAKDAATTLQPSNDAAPVALVESEAIGKVLALPEYKALSSQVVDEGGVSRRMVPIARVVAKPELVSAGDGVDRAYFEIIVADRASFDPDGGFREAYPPELHLRVHAYTGAISVKSEQEGAFREYAAWAAAQRQRKRAAALVMSTPEWKTRAARIRRSNEASDLKPELGLLFGSEPTPGCRSGAADCRYGFTAMRVCAGCAGGLWTEFEVDFARQTLFVKSEDFSSTIPYGTWRNLERVRAAKEIDKESRALGSKHAAFPDYRPGHGPLGYGEPTTAKPTTVAAAARAALARGGYALQRSEHYADDFIVYVVGASNASSLPEASGLRAWGAELVRASGGRACEVVVQGSTRRYQFDRFALKEDTGGVYVLIDDAFHPWLAPDAE